MKVKTPRNDKYLKFIRSQECIVTGRVDSDWTQIHAHHVRAGNGAGLGQKVSDYYTIPLCAEEHGALHNGSETEYYRRHGIDTDQEIVRNLLIYIARHVQPEQCRSMRDKLAQIIEEELR